MANRVPDTVLVIKGPLTDDELDQIAAFVRRSFRYGPFEIASGPGIVGIEVDCGEGRRMKVGLRWFFDMLRRGALLGEPDDGAAQPADVDSPGVRLE